MKKLVFIIFLLPITLFAQYTGGSSDGYSSKEVIVKGWSLSNSDFSTIMENIIVSPNPTDNFIYISFNEAANDNIDAIIIDINGRVISRKKLSKENRQFDLSNQNRGVYILQIWIKNTLVATRKLIKK